MLVNEQCRTTGETLQVSGTRGGVKRTLPMSLRGMRGWGGGMPFVTGRGREVVVRRARVVVLVNERRWRWWYAHRKRQTIRMRNPKHDPPLSKKVDFRFGLAYVKRYRTQTLRTPT